MKFHSGYATPLSTTRKVLMDVKVVMVMDRDGVRTESGPEKSGFSIKNRSQDS